MEIKALPFLINDDAEVIHEGIMSKRGDIIKNVKSRYFIAFGRREKFRIDYYSEKGGQLKGSVVSRQYRIFFYFN